MGPQDPILLFYLPDRPPLYKIQKLPTNFIHLNHLIWIIIKIETERIRVIVQAENFCLGSR